MRRLLAFVIMLTVAFSIMTVSAKATTTEEIDYKTIIFNLLENGETKVNIPNLTKTEAQQYLQQIQDIIDAVVSSSTTPKIKGSVGKEKTKDSYLKLSLEYTEEDLTPINNLPRFTTVTEINDYLCNAMNYDYSGSNNSSAIVALNKGVGICQAYANAFELIASNSNVKSIKVRGYTSQGEFHVVNLLEGNMVVDVTFNDSTVSAQYLLISLEDYCAKTGFTPTVDTTYCWSLKYPA